MRPLDTTELSFAACAGESITYDNQTLAAGTVTSFTYPDQNGCDSTVIVTVCMEGSGSGTGSLGGQE